jgi:hypothetical protein
MRTERSVTMKVLRFIATVFALAPLIGLLVTLYGMITAYQTIPAGAAIHTADVARSVSMALIATFAGLLLFPLGVCLHWIVAKKTGSIPSWARRALFWGSLFACIDFPLGTIMGGVTIWLLVTSKTFRDRGQSPFR